MNNSVNGEAPGIYRANTTVQAPRPPRDRYFDALRAAAIVRVVVFHMFSAAWLSMIFPSMGVMFALGGSLMAKSVERSAAGAISGRLRRLLPALWVMGLVLIPAMFLAGWANRPDGKSFLMWVVPMVEPPSSPWAEPVTGVLWYLVAYLWMVLLSPVLLWLYRRAKLATIILPFFALFAWDYFPEVVPDSVASAATDVMTFVSCWVLGFAHRLGDLRKVSFAVLSPLAAVAVGAALAWTLTHPGEDGVADLANEPIAYGVYSLGFVLVLLRIGPTMHWLTGRKALNGLVNLCNARAVTIYLWHNVAITLCFLVGDRLPTDQLGSNAQMVVDFGIALVMLAGFIGLLGWVEDVAARRPVRLLPWSVVPPSRPKRVTPEWSGPIWF
jgi:peptidoglycan/LPS O-acetylase OafA/YrhL